MCSYSLYSSVRAPRVQFCLRILSWLSLVTYINKNGRRVTTESSYLTPDVVKRANLTIATGASVTKILFDSPTEGELPRAAGVEFSAKASGPTFRVRAKKEVIVS